jgi:hypothetical protein
MRCWMVRSIATVVLTFDETNGASEGMAISQAVTAGYGERSRRPRSAAPTQ